MQPGLMRRCPQEPKPLPISDHSEVTRPLAGRSSAWPDLTSGKSSPGWDVCGNTAQALGTSEGKAHSRGPVGEGRETSA